MSNQLSSVTVAPHLILVMSIEKKFADILRNLIALIRTSTQVHKQDVGFFRTLDRDLGVQSANASRQLLDLINLIIAKSNHNDLSLESLPDVQKKWPAVQTVFDYLVDCADEFKKTPSEKENTPVHSTRSASPVVHHDKSLSKPQEKFAVPIDNSFGPFRPLLAEKPFALVDLNDSTVQKQPDDSHEGQWFDHPYRAEIDGAKYPDFVYQKSNAIPAPDPAKLNAKPVTMVDTRAELSKMIKALSKFQQIAVDLEHHDYRSYMGIVCLMQISTPKKDYLVDPLALRSELQALNKVFCDPNILKVFHGARQDILWLQRDLGLYIVNLFDTFHACRALVFPRASLAYLLENIAHFKADKKYQLADWRQRPLSQEMQDYARADTHFLLYIAQELRNKLIDKGLLGDVLAKCRETAKLRYEKPEYNLSEPSWVRLAIKFRLDANDNVLEAVYRWRDQLARDNDESPNYVLQNHVLAHLVQTKPDTVGKLISILGPHVPQSVRHNANQLANIIKKAKALPAKPPYFPTTSWKAATIKTEERDVDSLRATTSSIFGPRKYVYKVAMSEIDWHQFSMDTLKASSIERTRASTPKDKPESKSIPEESQASKAEPSKPKRNRKGRKTVQIIGSADDIDVQPAPKKAKKADNSEAFDFESAAPIMKSTTEGQESFSQYGRKSKGPRGAKARSAKNGARTTTYRNKK